MQLRTQKIFALAGITLLALNLRTAVSSLSPVVGFIQSDIALPIVTIGLLGIAAPLAFALASGLSYRPARRFGVEVTLIFVVLAIVAGHMIRALAWDSTALFFGSLLCLFGTGVGNVLLPVMVRKYFEHRIGLISAFYITLTSVSATIGSLFAVPVSEAFGWRLSLGQWALLAALTLLPLAAIKRNSAPEPKVTANSVRRGVWRSRTALAIAGAQAMTSVFGYVSFAWLPLLLIEHNGVSASESGAMLALFAIMGFPVSLAVPQLAQRFPKLQPKIVYFSATMGALGPLGLLFFDGPLWLWVVLIGLGPTMFPLALTLMNLRAREKSVVLSVSSFGQGVSYTIATIAVMSVGLMRELTGGWEYALWMLCGSSLISILAGIQLAKHKMVDDELS